VIVDILVELNDDLEPDIVLILNFSDFIENLRMPAAHRFHQIALVEYLFLDLLVKLSSSQSGSLPDIPFSFPFILVDVWLFAHGNIIGIWKEAKFRIISYHAGVRFSQYCSGNDMIGFFYTITMEALQKCWIACMTCASESQLQIVSVPGMHPYEQYCWKLDHSVGREDWHAMSVSCLTTYWASPFQYNVTIQRAAP
jgi:hypothetical protein